MLTLTLRTDKPEAEIGLYDDGHQLSYERWQAHRQLAETIHSKLIDTLQANGKYLHDLQAIIVFQGPGSFTGLRIGITVANALAQAFEIPIVAAAGDTWIDAGLHRLAAADDDTIALPEYGAAPNITAPRH